MNNISFIKSGRVKIYRAINFRVNKYSGDKLKGDIKDPSPEELANNIYKTELIEIDELSIKIINLLFYLFKSKVIFV